MGALVIVLTIAVLVHPEPLPGEVGYVRGLQDLGEPVPSLAEVVRTMTSTPGALVVLVIPAIAAIVRFGARGLGAVAIALLALLVVQPVTKEIVDRPRPTATHVDVRAGHTSKSYPSGHSLSTTVVWGALAAFAVRRHRPLLAVIALVPVVLTFFASGVQGVHWPTDALAGTVIGALAACAALAVLPEPSQHAPGAQ